MRPILFAPLLLAAGATAADSRTTAEAEIAGLIAGRVAGATVKCLSTYRIEGLRPIGDRTLVARTGNRIWINRLPESCPTLRSDSIPVVQILNGEYCRNDIFTTASPYGLPGGNCRLGSFTRYDKP